MRPVAASTRQPMSQKLVQATCLISGSASPVSRTNGDVACAASSTSRDLRRGRAGRQPRVHRREDAAVERHQVRREGDVAAERLRDLGRVPMAEQAVGGDAAVVLAEVRALGRRLAGARDARLGVDDDVGVAAQQAGRGQRLQGQQRRRRVAARARHQRRAGDPRRPRTRSGRRRRRPAAPSSPGTTSRARRRRAGGTRPTGRSPAPRRRAAPARPRPTPLPAAPGTRPRRRGRRRRGRAAPPRRPRCAPAPAACAARSLACEPVASVRRGEGMPGQQPDQLLAGIAGGAGDRDARRGGGGRGGGGGEVGLGHRAVGLPEIYASGKNKYANTAWASQEFRHFTAATTAY